jgi:hypothetical protein
MDELNQAIAEIDYIGFTLLEDVLRPEVPPPLATARCWHILRSARVFGRAVGRCSACHERPRACRSARRCWRPTGRSSKSTGRRTARLAGGHYVIKCQYLSKHARKHL